MFRARERGMSFWPFAVSLLAVVVLLVMFFSVSSERDQAKSDKVKADARATDAENAKKDYIGRIQKASNAVGFLGTDGVTDPASVEAQLKDYGPKLRDALTIEVAASKYTAQDGGASVVKEGADSVKVQYLSDADLADATTLQAFLSKFETAANRMKLDNKRFIDAAAQAAAEKAEATNTATATIGAKDKRIAELTGEKAAVENQMREQTQELKDQLAQATAAKEQKEGEFEALRKQASENEAKLVTQINELTGNIKTLVQREAPALTEGPDGEVVVAADGVAILNRGKNQWLMPGTVFDVWGLAKGGAKYKKGSVKVTSCDNETARAAILEDSARDPIAKGDLIQSLVYSPNRKLHFVLVGDFKKMGRSQAEAVLSKLGAAVDGKVTSETNYLVVGAPPAGQESLDDTDQVKAAKDLGIRMITEEQLASFTRY